MSSGPKSVGASSVPFEFGHLNVFMAHRLADDRNGNATISDVELWI